MMLKAPFDLDTVQPSFARDIERNRRDENGNLICSPESFGIVRRTGNLGDIFQRVFHEAGLIDENGKLTDKGNGGAA